MKAIDLVKRDSLPNMRTQVVHMISRGLGVCFFSVDSTELANMYNSCDYRKEGYCHELSKLSDCNHPCMEREACGLA